MSAPPSLELGQTQDPALLIPGNPSVVRENVTNISTTQQLVSTASDDVAAVTDADAVASGMTSIFYGLDRASQITRYEGLDKVLGTAYNALNTYAGALAAAQGIAQDAITRWNEGEQATATAKTAHEEAAHAYEESLTKLLIPSFGPTHVPIPTARPGPPGLFIDPGETIRKDAQEMLAHGRDGLRKAASAALKTLGAPQKADEEKNSSSGDIDWLGADGSMEGPSISWDFWEKKFGTKDDGEEDSPFKITLGKIEGGVYVFNAKGEFENYYGDVKVNGDGSVTVLGADGSAEATINKDGVKVHADGTIEIVKAEGNITGSLGPAELGLHGEALVGATAEADITIGKDGVHGGGELFAGGKLSGELSGDVYGAGGELRGELQYGIGASADLDVGVKDGKITIGGDLGLAFGPGGKLGGGVSLDVPEIYGHGKDVVDAIFG